MARINPNTHTLALDKTTKKDGQSRRTVRLLLLEASVWVPKEEKKVEPNLLALVNVLLALKPDKLVK